MVLTSMTENRMEDFVLMVYANYSSGREEKLVMDVNVSIPTAKRSAQLSLERRHLFTWPQIFLPQKLYFSSDGVLKIKIAGTLRITKEKGACLDYEVSF